MSEKKEYPIKTRIVRITDKKTGVVYLEERRTQYDPQKGWNRVISTRRTGEKIMEGKTEPQKCRPKRHSGDPKVIADASTAERKRIGMTQILEWVGSESGVDKAVYDAFPSRAVAEKVISVARYLVATNKTVHNIADFQYEHDLPYEHGLSEDVCYDLFRDVGHDEASTQRLFQRLSEIGQVEQGVIAFDSTTISTYAQGEQTPFARQGYNKDGDGLDTYKMLTMFSVTSGLPISFELQPGNIPDVSSLVNTVKRLETYQIKRPLLILDTDSSARQILLISVGSMSALRSGPPSEIPGSSTTSTQPQRRGERCEETSNGWTPFVRLPLRFPESPSLPKLS